MDIIIDGYNLIGSQGGLWGDIPARRAAFLAELARYVRIKGHSVTVVFDGSDSGALAPDLPTARVRVLFSQGETADDVVIRLAAEIGTRGTIVSSDREVQRRCRSHGCVVLGVKEFERRLATVTDEGYRSEPVPLGEESPAEVFEKDESDSDQTQRFGAKKGNPFKRSKVERQKRKRLERL